MPYIRGKKGERGRQVWRANCRHCQILDTYQAARDNWDRLRESGQSAGGLATGSSHSNAGYYQLSDEEFRELHPPPRFRDFLIEMRAETEDEIAWREGA